MKVDLAQLRDVKDREIAGLNASIVKSSNDYSLQSSQLTQCLARCRQLESDMESLKYILIIINILINQSK